MRKLYEDILREMPDGWQNAFGMDLCVELEDALKKAGIYRSAQVLQVKEKFGELRIYLSPTCDEAEAVIDKYTKRSRHTCIECGGKATKISTGWISPWCEKCANTIMIGHHMEPIENFWEEEGEN